MSSGAPAGIQTTRQTKGCVFNINPSVPKEWRKTDTIEKERNVLREIEGVPGFLRRLKDRMRKIFADAGQTLVFGDPKAASGTRGGNFNLSYRNKFSFFGAIGAIVEPSQVGWMFGSKGEVSISKLGRDVSDLATAGTHEAAHKFLRKFPGNDRSGHSEGIMAPFLNTTKLSGMSFTPERARYLSSLCK